MHRTSVEWLHSLEKGTERDELVTDATPQGRGPAVAGSLRRVRPGHSGSGRTAGRRPQGQTRSPRKGLEKRVPTDDRWNDRLDIRGRFRSWFGLHDGQGHRARQGDERTRRRPTLRPRTEQPDRPWARRERPRSGQRTRQAACPAPVDRPGTANPDPGGRPKPGSSPNKGPAQGSDPTGPEGNRQAPRAKDGRATGGATTARSDSGSGSSRSTGTPAPAPVKARSSTSGAPTHVGSTPAAPSPDARPSLATQLFTAGAEVRKQRSDSPSRCC